MPEGDTVHYAANRIRPVLEGQVPDELVTPHRRFAKDRWPERLGGRAVTRVDAIGKHLLLRFEGGLTIHSHLRMTGSWRVLPADRAPSGAVWLVIRRGDRHVLQLRGPVLELMTDSRTRLDRRIAGLGPDIVAAGDFDTDRFLRRLREDDPTRPIGDALLDQRIVAGIGNLWKAEGCFAAGLDPWRPTGQTSDSEAVAVIEATRPRMQKSAIDGMQDRFKVIYGKAGQPCPRCGDASRIRSRGGGAPPAPPVGRHKASPGDDNRLTYWCPCCQT